MFANVDKWYMHRAESFQENKTYKIRWNFEIQTNLSISARKPDLVLIGKKKKKKKTCQRMDFAISADNEVKIKENEKLDSYLDLVGKLRSYRTFSAILRLFNSSCFLS